MKFVSPTEIELDRPEFEGACGRKDVGCYVFAESISYFVGNECVGTIPREIDTFEGFLDAEWELMSAALVPDYSI